MDFLDSLLINLPVSNICIGKIIKLYLGKIEKNANIKISVYVDVKNKNHKFKLSKKKKVKN